MRAPRRPTGAQLDLLGLAMFCEWRGVAATAAEIGRLHVKILGVERAAPNVFRDLAKLVELRLLRHPSPHLYVVTREARAALDEGWREATSFHRHPRRFLLTLLARLPASRGAQSKARDFLVECSEEAQTTVISALSKRPHPDHPKRLQTDRLPSGVPSPEALLGLLENFETSLLLLHLRFLDDLDDYVRGDREMSLQTTGADLNEAVAREHGTAKRRRLTTERAS